MATAQAVTDTKIISIHALLAESDAKRLMQQDLTIKFLSTLSLRRATDQCRVKPLCQGNFYPRSPCGERLLFAVHVCAVHGISIHALLAESDVIAVGKGNAEVGISIHALLAESDGGSPHHVPPMAAFLSTLSLRRATTPPGWGGVEY